MKLNIINNIKAGWRTAMGALILATAATGCADDLPGQYDSYGNSGVSISLTDVGNLPGYGAQSRVATTFEGTAIKSRWTVGDAITLSLDYKGADGQSYSIKYSYTAANTSGSSDTGATVDKWEASSTDGTAINNALRQLKAAAHVATANDGTTLSVSVSLSGNSNNVGTHVYGTETFKTAGIILNGTDIASLTGVTTTADGYTIPLFSLDAGSDITKPFTLNFRIKGWERTSALVVLTNLVDGNAIKVESKSADANPVWTEVTDLAISAVNENLDAYRYLHLPNSGTYRIQRTNNGTSAYINPNGEAGDAFVANHYYLYDVQAGPNTPGEVEANQDYSVDAAGNYTVYTGTGLAKVAELVNDGKLDKNITLASNVDMTGIAYTPIGTDTDYGYAGDFDGKGYTISNLKVEGEKYAGLISQLGGNALIGLGSVKNVTLENPAISGTVNAGAIVGWNSNCTITDCHVVGTDYDNHYVKANAADPQPCYAGGIAGFSNGANASITNCSVTGMNIESRNSTGYKDAGAIVGSGTADASNSESGNKVNDIVQ